MRRPRRPTLAALLAALLAAAPPVRAERPAVRTTGISRQGGVLLVDLGLQDLFWPEHRDRLRSGFTSRILIRAFLYRVGDDTPLDESRQAAEIVWDLWEERYQVRVVGARGEGDRFEDFVATPDEAIARATVLRRFPVADATRLSPQERYFIAFRADLNPISEELVKDVRRWLVQPPSGQRRFGPGDSFFGSFVNVFINPHIDESERQLRVFSQPFSPPPAPRGKS